MGADLQGDEAPFDEPSGGREADRRKLLKASREGSRRRIYGTERTLTMKPSRFDEMVHFQFQ